MTIHYICSNPWSVQFTTCTPKIKVNSTVFVYNDSHLSLKLNMVIIELYKPRATYMIYIGGNEEFSKSKTTKLFYFTRDSRLIFQS